MTKKEQEFLEVLGTWIQGTEHARMCAHWHIHTDNKSCTCGKYMLLSKIDQLCREEPSL